MQIAFGECMCNMLPLWFHRVLQFSSSLGLRFGSSGFGALKKEYWYDFADCRLPANKERIEFLLVFDDAHKTTRRQR